MKSGDESPHSKIPQPLRMGTQVWPFRGAHFSNSKSFDE
jgi:hypothetical protein